MQAHKQCSISSAVFLWCDIMVIFIAGFIFTGVCQAVLAPLQAHVLRWSQYPFSWNIAIHGTTGTHRALQFTDCFQACIPSAGCEKEAAVREDLWFHLVQWLLQAHSAPCSSRRCGTGRSTPASPSSSAATRRATLSSPTDPVGKCAPLAGNTYCSQPLAMSVSFALIREYTLHWKTNT